MNSNKETGRKMSLKSLIYNIQRLNKNCEICIDWKTILSNLACFQGNLSIMPIAVSVVLVVIESRLFYRHNRVTCTFGDYWSGYRLFSVKYCTVDLIAI